MADNGNPQASKRFDSQREDATMDEEVARIKEALDAALIGRQATVGASRGTLEPPGC
jgi:hypothetical protein